MSPPNDPYPRFRASAAQAAELVARFGTPLYVLDETHFRARIRTYLGAFRAVSPGAELSYASKANSTLALIRIAHEEGCQIDVASEGELRAAIAAGVPPGDCVFHGSNKTAGELRFALDCGIGHIVVDHFGEIAALAAMLDSRSGPAPRLVLRLAPGVDPITHHRISTGQADTKFGFNISDDSAERAVEACLRARLPLVGFHCHVGSQLLDPEAQQAGGEILAQFAVDMKRRLGFEASYLNVGGGLGVRYTDGDRPMPVDEYCRLVVHAISKSLEGSGLSPTLGQEPGRALVAESGITLYTVGVVKTVPAPQRGSRTYVAVDGGLSDNPRPALYGSKYTVERILKLHADLTSASSALVMDHTGPLPPVASPVGTAGGDSEPVTVSGKHCETDPLFEDVVLPADIGPGDILQVLCTGAYNASMASNYNRYPRPAAVLIREDGSYSLVQRREEWDEMLAREILPEGL